MELQPLYDRIIVKRQEREATSKGGIVLPGESQDKNNLATIVAVGHGYLDQSTGNVTPLKVEVGQTVMIGKWAGDEVKIENEDHLVIKESEILAVVVG